MIVTGPKGLTNRLIHTVSRLLLPAHICYVRCSLSSKYYEPHAFYRKHPAAFPHLERRISTYISSVAASAHYSYDRYSLSSKYYEPHAFYRNHFWCFSTFENEELQIALDCTPKLFTVDLMRCTNSESNDPLTHMASCG